MLFGTVATLVAVITAWIAHAAITESLSSIFYKSNPFPLLVGFWIFTGLAALASGMQLVFGLWTLEGARYMTLEDTVLSSRERFRASGFVLGVVLGFGVTGWGLLAASAPAPFAASGYGVWFICAYSLMTGGWQDRDREEERLTNRAEAVASQEAWRRRRKSMWTYLDPRQMSNQPRVTLARRFALEWLWLLGSVAGLGLLSLLRSGVDERGREFFVGAVFGVFFYFASIIVRVTLWSLRRVFGNSTDGVK